MQNKERFWEEKKHQKIESLKMKSSGIVYLELEEEGGEWICLAGHANQHSTNQERTTGQPGHGL